MKLYEIDEELIKLFDSVEIDEETGEIINGLDVEKFDQLILERDKKLEGIGIYIKQLLMEAEDLKEESKSLKARADRKSKKAENLKNFLSTYLLNNKITKFETTKVVYSFRRSDVVEADEDLVPRKFFKKKIEYALDKVGIKTLLKSGKSVKGAQLIEKQNLQIK